MRNCPTKQKAANIRSHRRPQLCLNQVNQIAIQTSDPLHQKKGGGELSVNIIVKFIAKTTRNHQIVAHWTRNLIEPTPPPPNIISQ